MEKNEKAGGSSNVDGLFEDLDYPVRSDLNEQCRASWRRLAEVGEWWTSAERVAIAEEVRLAAKCDVCARRKESLSPYVLKELHMGKRVLSPMVIDTVHRVATDAWRLKRDWFDELRLDGLSDGEIVEMIAIVATVAAIDRLARGLGTSRPDLPEAEEGDPTAKRPAGAAQSFAWVSTVPVDKAEGDLAEYYRKLGGSDGQIPHVQQALSYVPSEAMAISQLSNALYLPVGSSVADAGADPGRAVSRAQMEWIATTVSSANECYY
ncbi:MAG: hypothetical protein GY866_38240 [Proteobacteria bacterium]|nr:hypothetical protein [Pseudomonadota bacterium]